MKIIDCLGMRFSKWNVVDIITPEGGEPTYILEKKNFICTKRVELSQKEMNQLMKNKITMKELVG